MISIMPRPLEKHELKPEVREELEYVCEALKERNGKTIKEKEYEISKGYYYRGELLGNVAACIYTFSPPVLKSKIKGNRIFVDSSPEMPIEYANYYATNQRIIEAFEREQRKKSFSIPSGGAILLEIQKEKVKVVERSYAERHLYGILIEGKKDGIIYLNYLSENCKKYILKELKLGKESFAYEALFK